MNKRKVFKLTQLPKDLEVLRIELPRNKVPYTWEQVGNEVFIYFTKSYIKSKPLTEEDLVRQHFEYKF